MKQIELADQIEQRYRSYLSTFFHIKNPELKRSFDDALSSGHLSKGPYLQSTAVFKRGQKLESLYQELFGLALDPGVASALTGNRNLYLHQENAIRNFAGGRNTVISTGTGSGKTEAFLIPIILHLYNEHLKKTLDPGVRALILYPMNALANDQRDRLVAAPQSEDMRGGILDELRRAGSEFKFTVGQYIGETPENENDRSRKGPEKLARAMPGEILFRSQMRLTPPNILLTNYSMLEYLLLRPDDSPLFDQNNSKTWTFLVLDEAHQYRGARGIEMAMLLRRLKNRLRSAGCANEFRCIATSASLVDGNSDSRGAVAEFATKLFDEPFYADDIILGESEPMLFHGTKKLSVDRYTEMLLEPGDNGNNARVKELANSLGIEDSGSPTSQNLIAKILYQDERASLLRAKISSSARSIVELADELFPELDQSVRKKALADLVQLCLQARDPISQAPLLSARYHHFLRAMEGAFLSLGTRTELALDRRSGDDGKLTYEMALCRECGQHYIVGQIRDGRLVEAIRDPSDEDFGAQFFLPVDSGQIEESVSSDIKTWNLCTKCGTVWALDQSPRCGHHDSVHILQPEDSSKEDQAKSCLSCGYSGPDPIREVSHGTDGPHAVIATTLFENLPRDRSKVLAFADGRQEAAFFAWYLDSSYRELFNRNLILASLRSVEDAGALTLREAALALRESYLERAVHPQSMGQTELLREAWLSLYRELLSNEQRISLEGVGLLRWDYMLPELIQTPQILKNPPWSLDEPTARSLIKVLLDSMRQTRAVELTVEKNIPIIWSDLELPSQKCVCIGPPRNQYSVSSWDGKLTRRGSLLKKLLAKLQPDLTDAKVTEVLSHIWESIEDYDRRVQPADRIFVTCANGKRLNSNWWRLQTLAPDYSVLRCDKCTKIDHFRLAGICTRHGCYGNVQAATPDQMYSNHYRTLYTASLPGILRVEEHTAQLDTEKAREYQRDFKEGRIDVLSCSTTFELGVDLGDLDTVFLRNVPPESFNYDQRVGRSGRRAGNAGFALTFCKRSPHDLYHYIDPLGMISGKVKPPVLSLSNSKIILRHLMAVALSEFFRGSPDRFDSVKQLFVDMNAPSAVRDFKRFLLSHKAGLEKTFNSILPDDVRLRQEIGFDDGSWIEKLAGDDSRFALAEYELSDDYKLVQEHKKEMISANNFDGAKWANARIETLEGEQVLSFLSRKTVIPKYGFPVDVVELDTHKVSQRDVAFSRDLAIAISEFAPSAKLIANKREWQSIGIKKIVNKELAIKHYWRCIKHNAFFQWSHGESTLEKPCSCALNGKYIIPSFGFVTSKDPPKEPQGRAGKVFSTRPYFVRSLGGNSSALSIPPDDPVVVVSQTMPGIMVVLCEGKKSSGFTICQKCGIGGDLGASKKKRNSQYTHVNQHGAGCSGTLETHLSLGHEFETDILRVQFLKQPSGLTNPLWFAYSLASAVVEGAAEVLQVPASDISVTVGHVENSNIPPIIVYDNVPGGAGLVARLEDAKIFEEVLVTARQRVSGQCLCSEESSCYACLRSYRNQFVHSHLQRGPVFNYLNELLARVRQEVTVTIPS